jgi:DNA-binding HxlR family transcriptional regulator
MAERSYGQFCGLARALDLVGERWAMLIVRDLLVGPKRFTDLRRGLPRIPTNILTARLKELEQAGVVERRVLPRPAGSVVYDLTAYGRDLEDVVLRLGRWGARSLGFPREGEIVTPDSMVMALRAMFRPEAAADVRAVFELRLGDVVLHARVDAGTLAAGVGPATAPDLVVEAGPGIRALFAGELSPADAVRTGEITALGDPALLDAFAAVFRLDASHPAPARVPS